MTSPARGGPDTAGTRALAAVLGDWRARYGRAIPEATELLAALEMRGFTVVDQAHEGCRAAVEHVAEHHHGPDYPKCAASWTDVQRLAVAAQPGDGRTEA